MDFKKAHVDGRLITCTHSSSKETSSVNASQLEKVKTLCRLLHIAHPSATNVNARNLLRYFTMNLFQYRMLLF